jgi:hypothetical protein
MPAPPESQTAPAANWGSGIEDDNSVSTDGHSVSASCPQAQSDLLAVQAYIALLERDRNRIAYEIDQAFRAGWDKNIVAHPCMHRWCDELLYRVWKEKVRLHRLGTVSNSWEELVEEIEAFSFVNHSMQIEFELRAEPPEPASTLPQDGSNVTKNSGAGRRRS